MQLLDAIFDGFFPARCLGCEKNMERQKETLCNECRKKIILPQTLFCGICGARLPLNKKICHRDTPYLLGSIGPYENPVIKNLVLSLKFKRIESTAEFLGRLLGDYLTNLQPPLETGWLEEVIIIPIPLSRERYRERGFNQSALVAKALSDYLDLETSHTNLIRTRHTPPQSLSETTNDRHENVRGAFSVSEPAKFLGKKIILIDDVTTTGATLKSAAAELKQAGAKEILALTIAY